ncbi:hypothetical protein Efla_004158 [Eimeria flavescens]
MSRGTGGRVAQLLLQLLQSERLASLAACNTGATKAEGSKQNIYADERLSRVLEGAGDGFSPPTPQKQPQPHMHACMHEAAAYGTRVYAERKTACVHARMHAVLRCCSGGGDAKKGDRDKQRAPDSRDSSSSNAIAAAAVASQNRLGLPITQAVSPPLASATQQQQQQGAAAARMGYTDIPGPTAAAEGSHSSSSSSGNSNNYSSSSDAPVARSGAARREAEAPSVPHSEGEGLFTAAAAAAAGIPPLIAEQQGTRTDADRWGGPSEETAHWKNEQQYAGLQHPTGCAATTQAPSSHTDPAAAPAAAKSFEGVADGLQQTSVARELAAGESSVHVSFSQQRQELEQQQQELQQQRQKLQQQEQQLLQQHAEGHGGDDQLSDLWLRGQQQAQQALLQLQRQLSMIEEQQTVLARKALQLPSPSEPNQQQLLQDEQQLQQQQQQQQSKPAVEVTPFELPFWRAAGFWRGTVPSPRGLQKHQNAHEPPQQQQQQQQTLQQAQQQPQQPLQQPPQPQQQEQPLQQPPQQEQQLQQQDRQYSSSLPDFGSFSWLSGRPSEQHQQQEQQQGQQQEQQGPRRSATVDFLPEGDSISAAVASLGHFVETLGWALTAPHPSAAAQTAAAAETAPTAQAAAGAADAVANPSPPVADAQP